MLKWALLVMSGALLADHLLRQRPIAVPRTRPLRDGKVEAAVSKLFCQPS